MYLANPACAADNSVWVPPTASFDLEHALSGCKSALEVAAPRGVERSQGGQESASPPERAALDEIAASSDLPVP